MELRDQIQHEKIANEEVLKKIEQLLNTLNTQKSGENPVLFSYKKLLLYGGIALGICLGVWALSLCMNSTGLLPAPRVPVAESTTDVVIRISFDVADKTSFSCNDDIYVTAVEQTLVLNRQALEYLVNFLSDPASDKHYAMLKVAAVNLVQLQDAILAIAQSQT